MHDPIDYADINKNGINTYKSDSYEICMFKNYLGCSFQFEKELDYKYFQENIAKLELTDQQISHLLSKRASVANDFESVQWLVKFFNMSEKPYLMNNALSSAAYIGNLEMVKYFIALGADPHTQQDYAFKCTFINPVKQDHYLKQLEVAKYLYFEIGDIDIYADNMAFFMDCIFGERNDAKPLKFMWLLKLDCIKHNRFDPNLSLKDYNNMKFKGKNVNLFTQVMGNAKFEVAKLLLNLGVDYKCDNDGGYRWASIWNDMSHMCDLLIKQDNRYQKDQQTAEYLIVENGIETFRLKGE